MAYSDKVIDHYENPRNVGSFEKNDSTVGTGMVGAPACGDVMKLQIKVNNEGIITDAKFKTYGCGSAIASSSLITEWVKGKTLAEAGSITLFGVLFGIFGCATSTPNLGVMIATFGIIRYVFTSLAFHKAGKNMQTAI